MARARVGARIRVRRLMDHLLRPSAGCLPRLGKTASPGTLPRTAPGGQTGGWPSFDKPRVPALTWLGRAWNAAQQSPEVQLKLEPEVGLEATTCSLRNRR